MASELIPTSANALKEYMYVLLDQCGSVLNEHETQLLDPDGVISSLNRHYLIGDGSGLVGFAVTPKYADGTLIRVFIDPAKRRQGFGRFALEQLKITNLGCLKDNDAGVRFYQAIGFTAAVKYSPHILTFTREL